jgi:hypothetical protein
MANLASYREQTIYCDNDPALDRPLDAPRCATIRLLIGNREGCLSQTRFVDVGTWNMRRIILRNKRVEG